MEDKSLVDQIEIADATDTLRDARKYLDWFYKRGDFAPKSVWAEFWASVAPGRPSLLHPIFPPTPSAVQKAEEVLKRHGLWHDYDKPSRSCV